MKRSIKVVGALVASISLVVACSSDDDSATPGPVNNAGSCAILASQCHPYADTSALGNECHELGHAGDDTKCGPRLAQCQAECPKTDSGAHLPFEPVVDSGSTTENDGSTGSGDGAAPDAGPDFCTAYCDCLMPTCGSQAGFPHANVDSCKAKCATFNADDRACRGESCQKAKDLSEANRKHECEHASGAIDCH